MKCKLFNKFKSSRFVWVEKNFLIIIILSAIVAMAISMMIGLAQSVWFDEAYSIMLAKQPVSQILHLTSVDTHPPLYYIILSGWGNLFGWSEFALRSLSVIAMGGALVFASLLAKKMFGIRAAIMTLPFIVFAPFLLRYGFEIRMYSIASFIGIAATYILISALDSKKSNQIWLYGLYAILVALGVYTLYYTVLLWVAHFIWLIWRSYSNKESLIQASWPKAYMVSILIFLPWLPTFIKQITNGALAPISQSMTLDNLFGIITFSFLYRPVWQLDAILSLLVIFVILMLAYISFRAFKIVHGKQRQYLILLAMYIVVPIAILALVGLARPMYVERYLAHVLIGASMFVGISVALVTKNSKQSLQILCTLLTLTLTIGIIQLIQVGNYNFQRLQKPDISQAVKPINNCGVDTTILAADPYVAIELSYYLTSCKIHFYSDTANLSGGYAALSNSSLRIENPKSQLNKIENIYYFYYGQPKLIMPSSMISSSQQNYGALTVEHFTK